MRAQVSTPPPGHQPRSRTSFLSPSQVSAGRLPLPLARVLSALCRLRDIVCPGVTRRWLRSANYPCICGSAEPPDTLPSIRLPIHSAFSGFRPLEVTCALTSTRAVSGHLRTSQSQLLRPARSAGYPSLCARECAGRVADRGVVGVVTAFDGCNIYRGRRLVNTNSLFRFSPQSLIGKGFADDWPENMSAS